MNADVGNSSVVNAGTGSFASMIFMDCVGQLGNDDIAEAAIQGMQSYPHNACDIAFGAILKIVRTGDEGAVRDEIEKVIRAAEGYR